MRPVFTIARPTQPTAYRACFPLKAAFRSRRVCRCRFFYPPARGRIVTGRAPSGALSRRSMSFRPATSPTLLLVPLGRGDKFLIGLFHLPADELIFFRLKNSANAWFHCLPVVRVGALRFIWAVGLAGGRDIVHQLQLCGS